MRQSTICVVNLKITWVTTGKKPMPDVISRNENLFNIEVQPDDSILRLLLISVILSLPVVHPVVVPYRRMNVSNKSILELNFPKWMGGCSRICSEYGIKSEKTHI